MAFLAVISQKNKIFFTPFVTRPLNEALSRRRRIFYVCGPK